MTDNTESRIARLAQDRMPMSRDGDMTAWWFDLVNAWFLCDIVRSKESALQDPWHVRRMLSTTIVWG